MTYAQAAEFYELSPTTIQNWKRRVHSKLKRETKPHKIMDDVLLNDVKEHPKSCAVKRAEYLNKLNDHIVWGFAEGEIEVDESYFGGRCKRGRGAGNKVTVFGILKRNGSVYAFIIPNARADNLIPIIREKVKPDSIVYNDSFRSYNALDVSEFTHYRLNHSKEFAQDRNHINL